MLDEDLKNKIIKCDKWTMLHLKGSADNNHVYPIIHDKKKYKNWNYFYSFIKYFYYYILLKSNKILTVDNDGNLSKKLKFIDKEFDKVQWNKYHYSLYCYNQHGST